MKSRKTREVRHAPIRKGFGEDRKRDHWYYFLYVAGRKSAIYTKISHSQTELGAGWLSVMARQLRIGTAQFELFIDCELSEAGYIRLLVETAHIRIS